MKSIALFSLCIALFTACSSKEPEFSDLYLRMPRSEVLANLGEPNRIEYLIDTGQEVNLLVDQIPGNTDPNTIHEHWKFSGKRTYQITESRSYVKRGEITVIFGGRNRDPELVRGFWWTDAERLEAHARANET